MHGLHLSFSIRDTTLSLTVLILEPYGVVVSLLVFIHLSIPASSLFIVSLKIRLVTAYNGIAVARQHCLSKVP